MKESATTSGNVQWHFLKTINVNCNCIEGGEGSIRSIMQGNNAKADVAAALSDISCLGVDQVVVVQEQYHVHACHAVLRPHSCKYRIQIPALPTLPYTCCHQSHEKCHLAFAAMVSLPACRAEYLTFGLHTRYSHAHTLCLRLAHPECC